jgi:chemotaxis protein methyltransferase CheR
MALSSFDLDLIRKLVRERSGIVLGVDKNYLIESRLQPVAKLNGLDSLEMLCLRLRGGNANVLQRQVIEAMTTNETLFFRDGHPFETLTKVVLPDIMSRRQAQKRLVIWCAAASTGQEPYSVAMAIRDQLPSLLQWQLRIVATDIATDVLAKAKSGLYSQLEVSRGMPPAFQNRFLTKAGLEWQLKDEVRKMIEFRELNLLESYGVVGTADVVLMRNVLIYFDIETKRQILGKVRRTMAPDGYFFLGGAETTLNLDDTYERLPGDRGGCYRLRAAQPILAH